VLDFTKPKDAWQFWQYRPGPEPGKRIAPDKAILFSPQPLELIDPFEPVFVVEGQWDALTMHEHGYPCVSLLSAGQPTIAPDVLDYLGRAESIYFAYDNDGGTGFMAAQRLGPLLPSDRTFLFPWADWGVKDACELRSRCESADQFKQEISSLVDRIEDTEEDRDAQPEHYEYLDKLEKWDGKGPAPEPEIPRMSGMGDEAFHGIAGVYIRSLKGNSEASQEGMLVLFLAAFSSMVGFRAWTKVEENIHYPNLFAIIAGKSSRARKDTGLNRIIKPLREADEVWASECCKSHFASGEAQKEYFIKRQSDPRLFFADREFKGTISICAREGNTLSPNARSLYELNFDGGQLENGRTAHSRENNWLMGWTHYAARVARDARRGRASKWVCQPLSVCHRQAKQEAAIRRTACGHILCGR
jgi:hypothetical protein